MVVIKQLAPQDSDTVDCTDGIISNRSRFHSELGWHFGFYKSPRTLQVPVDISDVYRILGSTLRQTGAHCTRYAAVKCIEARLRLRAAKASAETSKERIPSLSVQPLIKDVKLDTKVIAVLDWIKRNGLADEKDVVDGVVRQGARKYRIDKKHKVRLHEGKAENYFKVCREIRANGPVIAGFTLREGANKKSYKKKKGAEMKDEKENVMKHAVILTGHKHFDGRLYFTFQDSSGPVFGDNGIGLVEAAALIIVYIPILKDVGCTWGNDLQFVG